jgi:membrane-associated protein
VDLIQGLHGVVAIVLFCTFLFAEEAGVPMPLPGELILVAGGILIATGGLDPWLFPPIAYASSLAGSMTGYSWARLVGERGLRGLAERIHQQDRLDRVTKRLQRARARDLALSRLLPGLRVYTTLAVGAAGVDRQRFLLGIAPATGLWMAFFVVLGVVVGAPAERVLGQLEGLIIQGGVLVVIGIAGYLAIRRVPEPGREMLLRLQPGLRTAFAMCIDLGLLASVVAGVLAVVRPLTPAGDLAGWIDIVVVLVVIALSYSVATHRGARATAGETLFGSSYLTPHAGPGQGGVRARLRRVLETRSPTSPALARTAERFRALADQRRLRIVELLLFEDRSLSELGRALNAAPSDLAYPLQELQRARLIAELEGGSEPRYAIADDQLRSGLAHLIGSQLEDG